VLKALRLSRAKDRKITLINIEVKASRLNLKNLRYQLNLREQKALNQPICLILNFLIFLFFL